MRINKLWMIVSTMAMVVVIAAAAVWISAAHKRKAEEMESVISEVIAAPQPQR